MQAGTDEARLAALTAIFKVLARWAPQARHDVVGACSPISLELSLLGVKSRRSALSAEDVELFIERGKKSIKNTVDEIDSVMLLQKQDRKHAVPVCDMLDKMARSTRTLFAGVDWSAPQNPADLGSDSEYDLTLGMWAVLMALLDRHGGNMQLRLFAQREGDDLMMDFSVAPMSPAVAENWSSPAGQTAPQQQLSIDEVHHLAHHLGFTFTRREGGIELRREAARAA